MEFPPSRLLESLPCREFQNSVQSNNRIPESLSNFTSLYQNMMDLLTIQHIVVGAIIFAMSCLLISFRRGRRSAPIVPRSQPTMFENMSVMRKQAGLTKLTYIYNICKSFREGGFGRSKYGATFHSLCGPHLCLPLTIN